MKLSELQALTVPELKKIAAENNPPIELAKRWPKPKIIETINNALNSTTEAPTEPDYTEFQAAGNDTVEEIAQDEAGQPVEPENGHGGARANAGNKPGNTEQAVRVKRAMGIEEPDEIIKVIVRRVSRFGKNATAAKDKLIEKISLYYTKAAEYLGIMEWIKNSPLTIIGGFIYYTIQLVKHMLGKDDAEPDINSDDNPDIRQTEHGEEQPRKTRVTCL